jgi:pyruvate/2-oxoglutarate dehydrogenase complex dihydrolipoamide acyltransferase (E2) component
MAAVAAALPHPVELRVVRYSSAGPESRLVTNASDLSLQGLAQALIRSGDNRPGGFVIVDVSGLGLLSTAVELSEAQGAALSMGVVTPRVAVGGDGVIAFRSTVQLALTYHPHLFSLLDAAKFLSAVRQGLERPSQAQC